MTCIFKTTGTSPGPIKFQPKPPNETPQKRHSLGSITPTKSSSGYESTDSGRSSMMESNSSLESISEHNDRGLKSVHQSEEDELERTSAKLKTSHVIRSHSDVGRVSRDLKRTSPMR